MNRLRVESGQPHSSFMDIVKKFAIISALTPLWLAQYLFWVPTVGAWRLMIGGLRVGTKLGFIGIVLLCLPIIGWILLGALALMRSSNRTAERRHTETLAALGHVSATAPRTSVWRPWMLGLISA